MKHKIIKVEIHTSSIFTDYSGNELTILLLLRFPVVAENYLVPSLKVEC